MQVAGAGTTFIKNVGHMLKKREESEKELTEVQMPLDVAQEKGQAIQLMHGKNNLKNDAKY